MPFWSRITYSRDNPYLRYPIEQMPELERQLIYKKDWRELQKLRIAFSIKSGYADIVQENISEGKLHGTVYFKRNTPHSRGVLLVHGFSGNRRSYEMLAQRLATYGFFCLSIDLPSHYMNLNQFTMGEISETVTEGVLFVKKAGNLGRVAVITHSVGGYGALFSNAGYTVEIEQRIYSIWERIAYLIEQRANFTEKETRMEQFLKKTGGIFYRKNEALIQQEKKVGEDLKKIDTEIEEGYETLRSLIIGELKQKIATNSAASCYVLISPPRSTGGILPGAFLLRHLSHKQIKTLVNLFMHKRLVKKGMGEPAQSPDEKYARWGFLKSENAKEFVSYFISLKTPVDFLKLIEDISRFYHKDDKTHFFEYYQKKYLLAPPKLFIYGKNDLILHSFVPFASKGLENFYYSCGNAIVKSGEFGHPVSNTVPGKIPLISSIPVITSIEWDLGINDEVVSWIIRFIERSM